MEFITIFFTFLAVLVLGYILYTIKTNKRAPILLEVFYLGIYGIVFLIFLFPNLLNKIQDIFGIQSAINFIVYLSIFVSYFLILTLYRKTEDQRKEITTLTREIAFLKKDKNKK